MTSCNMYIVIIYHIVIKEESNNCDRYYTKFAILHNTYNVTLLLALVACIVTMANRKDSYQLQVAEYIKV